MTSLHEYISKQILHYHKKSIGENRQILTKEHIDYVKRFLYEICPQKILLLTKEFLPMYSLDSLQKKASCVEEIINQMPKLANAKDLKNLRRLYQKDLIDYCAQNETLLLPECPIKSSDKFHVLLSKLLRETNELIWSISGCRFIMDLMQPPYGKEKCFANKVLMTLNMKMYDIVDKMKEQQNEMISFYEKRTRQIAKMITMPQFDDVRYECQMEERFLFTSFEIYSHRLRNSYGDLHRMAMENQDIIEDNFTQGLIYARYESK